MYINAKQELIEHIKDRKVKYVFISYSGRGIGGTLDEVLKELDFEYDNGYGGQELEGTIWYADGTWSERGEYDGSEWWEYKKCPEMPFKVKDNNIARHILYAYYNKLMDEYDGNASEEALVDLLEELKLT